MKPIHLNLASRPYEDKLPFIIVVVAAAVLTAALAYFNFDTYLRYKHETSSTRAKIEQLEAQTQQERQRKEIVERQLRSLNLSALDSKTRFINAKLTERAFSWSILLDELESVIARDVRLISVGPVFNPDGSITLNLDFQSKSADGMITTINRMHADPQFRNPFPDNESTIESGYAFKLVVEYLPPALPGAPTMRSAR